MIESSETQAAESQEETAPVEGIEVPAEKSPEETAREIVQQAIDKAAGTVPGEEPKIEEKPKEDAAKVAADKKASQQFAALSRKEKQVRDAERALNARMKAFEESQKKPTVEVPKEEPKDPIEVRIKRDPFGTLKELGLDFDHLTKVALNEGKLTPDMQLRLQQEELDRKYAAKLEALEKRLQDKEDTEKKQSEDRAQEQAVREFRGSIGAEVKSDPVAYEMLGLEGEDGIDLIFEVINSHYEATAKEGSPKIMSVKEAAAAVEAELLEVAKKYTGLSKVKGLFGAQTPAPKPASEVAKKGASPTLSNSQTATVPGKKVIRMSRDEELMEAAKLIKFQQ